MSELNLDPTTTIHFPNGKDKIMSFEIIIKPVEGFYRGGQFNFTFAVLPSYPHDPPKVKCKTKEPNPDDPLNKEAAEVLTRNPRKFEQLAQQCVLHGANVDGEYFPSCRAR